MATPEHGTERSNAGLGRRMPRADQPPGSGLRGLGRLEQCKRPKGPRDRAFPVHRGTRGEPGGETRPQALPLAVPEEPGVVADAGIGTREGLTQEKLAAEARTLEDVEQPRRLGPARGSGRNRSRRCRSAEGVEIGEDRAAAPPLRPIGRHRSLGRPIQLRLDGHQSRRHGGEKDRIVPALREIVAAPARVEAAMRIRRRPSQEAAQVGPRLCEARCVAVSRVIRHVRPPLP